MPGPLEDITVVELGAAIAGPYAGTILGDMGAEVIKVEKLGGGLQRTTQFDHDQGEHPTLTWRFLTLNRSKESIAVNLKTDEGTELVEKLLTEADVLIENMRPGVADSLGFGWKRLHKSYPGLIYCSVSGYGGEGPYRDMPALDTTIQGVSGFASQVGKGDRPGVMNMFVIDISTALYSALGIAMALFERKVSGEGQRIDVSMLDVAVSFLPVQFGAYSAGQARRDYEPDYGPSFVPNGHFATADGYLSLMIGPPKWEQFCELIDRSEWVSEDHAYGTSDGRLANRKSLEEDLESALAIRTTQEWLEFFADHGLSIPAAPVNDIEDMINDPQVRAHESVVSRDHPIYGEYISPNIVTKLSRTPGELSDAPNLGEDTDAILTALGYSEKERDALRAADVVA